MASYSPHTSPKKTVRIEAPAGSYSSKARGSTAYGAGPKAPPYGPKTPPLRGSVGETYGPKAPQYDARRSPVRQSPPVATVRVGPTKTPENLNLPTKVIVEEPLSSPQRDSSGIIPTIRREYGDKVLWALLIPLALLGLLLFTIAPLLSNLVPSRLGNLRNTNGGISVYHGLSQKEQNSKAVTDVLHAFTGIGGLGADKSKKSADRYADPVDFSKAAISIAESREDKSESALNREIDRFVERSREVDRSYRQFLAQRLEATAEAQGYVEAIQSLPAATDKKCLDRFMAQDYTKMAQRLLQEGKILLCQIDNNKPKHCPKVPNFVEIGHDLKNAISSHHLTKSGELFTGYKASTKKAVDTIQETLDRWGYALDIITKAQEVYDKGYGHNLDSDKLSTVIDRARKELDWDRTNMVNYLTNQPARFSANVVKLIHSYSRRFFGPEHKNFEF